MSAAAARLSTPEARRVAIAAQGLADPRPSGRVDRRHVRRLFDRVGLIQIDSVNVVARAQELALFARLGPHPRHLLPAMSGDGELFEYWGHEASHLPVALHPLLRWKMAAARDGAAWSSLVRMQRERPGFVAEVYTAVVERGPLVAGDLAERNRPKGSWWDWDHPKQALEWLFWTGRITARRRASDFARVYDLPERVLPAEVVEAPTPAEPDARKALLVLAARSLGVATAGDLADYHRQRLVKVRSLLAELVEEGLLLPAQVEGWAQPAYLHPETRIPRRVRARALVSPFDSLVWERSRAERLFRFRYRIEIYTPVDKRVHGYYVLPFLLGEHLVARVDLKADRARSTLLVRAVHAEPGTDHVLVAGELADELREMAGWLGLEQVVVEERGDLWQGLANAVGGPSAVPAPA